MKRLTIADLAKGIAIVFMIQVHTMELFIREDIYQGDFGKISLFFGGVPAAVLFMLIMGYFLAFNTKTSLVKRGLKLIGLGFLLNIGINFNLLYKIIFEGWQYDPWAYIFGVDILPLAGLSLISIAILKKFIGENPFIWIFPALLIAGLGFLTTAYANEGSDYKYLLSFITGGTNWSYFPLVPWLAYPITGYAVGLYIKNRKKPETSNLTAVFFAIITVSFLFGIVYGFNISSNLPSYYHHDLVFYLWAISFAILSMAILYFIDRKHKETSIMKYFQFLGRNVTTIYIIQWLVIGNTATEIYKTKDLWVWPASTVAVLFISSILAYIFEKLSQKLKTQSH